MLIRKSTSVGFQCCVCGKISTHTMELFSLGNKRNIILACPECGSEIFRAEKTKKDGYNVDVACPVCFTPHRYNMSMSQFWQSDILSLKCAFENSEALIFGDADKVKEAADSLFEPFEPFVPSEHYFGDYDDIDFEIDEEKEEFKQAMVNNFLRYLRLMNSDEDEILSVEDVLDSSYIPDEDMLIVRFIINICRLIELNKIECVCGKCSCGTTDVETQINDNILSVICNSCGRSIDIDLSREDILEELMDLDYIRFT